MSITPRERSAENEPTPERPVEQPDRGFGLVANGSSRLWDVAVDESLEREGEWSLELDGPTFYLVFQIRDLGVIPEAIDFLRRGLSTRQGRDQRRRIEVGAPFTLGKFSKSTVWLLWDDEALTRCFLVVGPNARSTMRLSLQHDDIEMLLEALRQVAEDLPEQTK